MLAFEAKGSLWRAFSNVLGAILLPAASVCSAKSLETTDAPDTGFLPLVGGVPI
jgi:hypothetical protein